VNRSLLVWSASAVTLALVGYVAKTHYVVKPAAQLAIEAATKIAAGHSLSNEDTTASPEDASQVDIVGPLAVWIRESSPAESEAEQKSAWKAQPMDHIVARYPMPEKYLRTQFRLNKSVQFRFVLPPHTVNTKLHGSFRSFVRRSESDHPVRITLSLMDAQQFEDLVHGRATESSFELQSSHHTVDFALPGVHEQPQEYHLIFSDNAASAKLFVRADFVVEAE